MAPRRIFVVGGELFAETLAHALAESAAVEVVGVAPTPEVALPRLQAADPDGVIVAVSSEQCGQALGLILGANPDLPVIRADLDSSDVHVILSRRIGAHKSDLIVAISALPKRS